MERKVIQFQILPSKGLYYINFDYKEHYLRSYKYIMIRLYDNGSISHIPYETEYCPIEFVKEDECDIRCEFINDLSSNRFMLANIKNVVLTTYGYKNSYLESKKIVYNTILESGLNIPKEISEYLLDENERLEDMPYDFFGGLFIESRLQKRLINDGIITFKDLLSKDISYFKGKKGYGKKSIYWLETFFKQNSQQK